MIGKNKGNKLEKLIETVGQALEQDERDYICFNEYPGAFFSDTSSNHLNTQCKVVVDDERLSVFTIYPKVTHDKMSLINELFTKMNGDIWLVFGVMCINSDGHPYLRTSIPIFEDNQLTIEIVNKVINWNRTVAKDTYHMLTQVLLKGASPEKAINEFLAVYDEEDGGSGD